MKERLKGNVCPVEVPGNRPYKEYKVLPMDIQVSDECMGCGSCVLTCPTGALSMKLVDPPESLQGYHQQPLENTWKEDR